MRFRSARIGIFFAVMSIAVNYGKSRTLHQGPACGGYWWIHDFYDTNQKTAENNHHGHNSSWCRFLLPLKEGLFMESPWTSGKNLATKYGCKMSFLSFSLYIWLAHDFWVQNCCDRRDSPALADRWEITWRSPEKHNCSVLIHCSYTEFRWE